MELIGNSESVIVFDEYTSYIMIICALSMTKTSNTVTIITNFRVCGVMTQDWQDTVKGLLKGELKKRNLSYKELAERLDEIGVKDSERNIANKIARGSFTAVFFVQCLKAIGCSSLRIDE